jgi:hypothetical protein
VSDRSKERREARQNRDIQKQRKVKLLYRRVSDRSERKDEKIDRRVSADRSKRKTRSHTEECQVE